MGRSYRVGEVAALTGVSVRTLHHYDRIGLLRPSGHSEAGHRLYAEADLLLLQQVLMLRYLGFPLARIGELLGRPDFDLLISLQVQRRALRERVAELERIDAVLAELIERRRATGQWAWELVARAAAAAQDGLAERGTTMDKIRELYTPEQRRQFEEVGQRTAPEEIEAIEREWEALLAEVRANRDLDPASAAARALADRWEVLTERTMAPYRDNPELMAAIGRGYEQGRFEGFDKAPQAADFAFIERVKAARS